MTLDAAFDAIPARPPSTHIHAIRFHVYMLASVPRDCRADHALVACVHALHACGSAPEDMPPIKYIGYYHHLAQARALLDGPLDERERILAIATHIHHIWMSLQP